MAESISSWAVRALGIVFVIAFLGRTWQENLKYSPTREDLEDMRWEIAADAATEQRGLVSRHVSTGLASPGLVMNIKARPRPSFRNGLGRYVFLQSAQQSRLASSNSLPH
jgi:hypothetical protein